MDDNQRARLQRMRREETAAFKNETYLMIPHLLELEAMIAAATEAFVAKPQLMGMDQFTFEEKIRISAALGVLDEEYVSGCQALNRLRNKIAHKIGYHVSKKDMRAIRACLPDCITIGAEKAVQKLQAESAQPIDPYILRAVFLRWVCMNLVARIGEIGNIFYGMKGKIDDMSYAFLQYTLARRDLSTVREELE